MNETQRQFKGRLERAMQNDRRNPGRRVEILEILGAGVTIIINQSLGGSTAQA